LERRRSDGKAEGRVFGKEESGGIGDGRVEGRGFLEVRDEFGEGFGIHDGTGELMRSDFAALFENVDIFGGELGLGAGVVVFLNEIGEMQGAGEAGGACADDQDVGFELFALGSHRSLNFSKILPGACQRSF
jgi:hypothetical protein